MTDRNFGWIYKPEEITKTLRRLQYPVLRCSPWAVPLLETDPHDVAFWKLEEKILGRTLPAHYQKIGSCFPAGTPVTMADGSEKRIETIAVGDMVMSHTGKPRRVTEVMQRSHTGCMTSVILSGFPFALTMTDEHPVFIHSNVTWKQKGFVPSPGRWCEAGILTDDVRILCPFAEPETSRQTIDLAPIIDNGEIVKLFKHGTVGVDWVRPKHTSKPIQRYIELDEDVAWLLGIYAAEGCTDYCRVIWSLHEREGWIADKIALTVKRLFGVDCKQIHSPGSHKLDVRLNSLCAEKFFAWAFPGKATTKRVPQFVYAMPRSCRLQFVRGWLTGDGHVTKDSDHTSVIGVTASHGLNRDMHRLLLSCGIKPTTSIRKRYAHQTVASTVLELNGENAVAVMGVERLQSRKADLRNASMLPHGFARAIKKLERFEVDRLPVYNLEVEVEHSYIANTMAVHNCVGQGFSRNVEHVIQADILAGENEEWRGKVAVCSIYGASRVEVGGGEIGGDGSVGAWAAEAVKKYGVLLRIKYPSIDLSSDDDDFLCSKWGNSGVPDNLEPTMREHCITAVSLVDGADIGLAALWNFKPVPTCSNRGFKTVRDKYGMCAPSGSWNHCMATAGALLIKHPAYPNGRQTVAIWQSWGQDSPTGNDKVILQTGQEETLPPGVFLIDVEVWDKMLKQGDSFALAGMKGWTCTLEDFFLLLSSH